MARTYGETLELVGKLAAAGLTDAEIGKAIDLAPASVKEVRELVGKAIGLLEGATAPKRGGRRPLSRRRAVLDLHGRGFGVDDSAIRLGVSAKAVARHLREAGVASVTAKVPETAQTGDAVRRRSGRTHEETVALVGKLAREGMPNAEIAAEVGLSPKSIRQYRHLAGVVLHEYRHLGEAETAEIPLLVGKGLTDVEIAARFGCSVATVKRHRQRAGLPSNHILGKARKTRSMVAGLAAKGRTDTEIIEATGLHPGTVIKHRLAAGIRYRDRSGGRIRKALDLLSAGVSAAEVAARLGLKESTVNGYKSLYRGRQEGTVGVYMPTEARVRRRSASDRVEEVAALVRDGLDDLEVASRTGLSLSSVRVYRGKAGLGRNGGRGCRRKPRA